jgi:hypothetical protein
MSADVSPNRDFERSTVVCSGRKLLQSECVHCGHVITSKAERGLVIGERAHRDNCPQRPLPAKPSR